MPGVCQEVKLLSIQEFLETMKDESELVAVMGHEIAHAVAKHSVERASAGMAMNVGTAVADIFLGGAISRTRNTVGKTTGVDILQVGVFQSIYKISRNRS